MTSKKITLKSIGKNISSLVAGEIVCRVIGAVILVILPRYLGPEDYGVYSLALSYFTIFAIFAGYGLDGLFIKDIARDKTLSQKYFCSNIIIKEILSFFAICILALVIFALNYSTKIILAIMILSLAIFLHSMAKTYSSVFRAYERMEFNAILEILRSLLTLLGIIIVIFFEGNITNVILLILFIHLLIAIIGYIFINRHFFKITWIIDWKSTFNILKKSTPFFLVGATAIIQNKVDLVMISKLATTVEVGLYSAANELVSVLYIIPNLVATALFPVFSRLYHESSKSLVLAGNHSVKCIAMVGFPISAGIYFVAPQVIRLIYGNDFLGSIIILQILGFGVCILFIANIIAYVLTASELVNHLTKANTLSIILNVILNFWLISIWGAMGAALASLICAIFRLAYIYIVFNYKFENVVLFNNFLKPMLATLFMGIVIMWSNANIIFTIPLGIITYGISIIVLKALNKDEIAMLRQMIPFLS